MDKLFDLIFDRARVVVLVFVCLLLFGLVAYLKIPKEAEPDVPIPYVYVSVMHNGISPEDGETLIIKPLEKELKNLDGLKSYSSQALEGYASVTMEFNAGFDQDQAMSDVREAVSRAKAKLPMDSEEPFIQEVNIALFPVISVVLSGQVAQPVLIATGKRLKEHLEAVPGVLKVAITGNREEMVEVVLDPITMQSYNLSLTEIAGSLQRNNILVAAGAIDNGKGRMVLKVPGKVSSVKDLLDLPLKTNANTVIRFQDVATVQRTYKDPVNFARLKGEPAVVLEVSKRLGSNIIQTIGGVRYVMDQAKPKLPAGVQVTFMQDKSKQIIEQLTDLQNSVITAIILVMVIMIVFMGFKPALLVGLSIPGSFLAGILVLDMMGYTLNMIVLFSLVLVVGMLVDDAIVTTEYADRKMAEGVPAKEAYKMASKRMFMPVLTSTLTKIVVFLPLIAWPGIIGFFMKYLPITVVITLTLSLVMGLVFIPICGQIIARFGKAQHEVNITHHDGDELSTDLRALTGMTAWYARFINRCIQMPIKVVAAIGVFIAASVFLFAVFNKGVEFFPDVEPDFIQVQVLGKGDLSIYEKDALVAAVEQEVLGTEHITNVYSRTLGAAGGNGQELPEGTVGVLQIELEEWYKRPAAAEIIQNLRNKVKGIAGAEVRVEKPANGPAQGKPIQIELRGYDSKALLQTSDTVLALINQIGGFEDAGDNRETQGVEWRVVVNREQAALYGADIASLGAMVQMTTDGVKLTDYRPADSDDEVDVMMRFPANYRNMEQLNTLFVPTSKGQIPAANFIEVKAEPKTSSIKRSQGQRVVAVSSNVQEGYLADTQLKALKAAIDKAAIDPSVQLVYKGEDQEQKETGSFLAVAFTLAMLTMLAMMLMQFNSFYQSMIVMSAIALSTIGVLLGLLLTAQPFGIVMCGLGVIALAGIVVGNNIILIDTYNILRRRGLNPYEAVLRTCLQRMRPVLLTSATAVLGLLPMVFALTIDLFTPNITVGAPSTQWWTQLSSSIAGGITFATIMTLVFTPCLLILGERKRIKQEGSQPIELGQLG